MSYLLNKRPTDQISFLPLPSRIAAATTSCPKISELSPRLLKDRNRGIGVFPHSEEILVRLPGQRGISVQHIRSREAELRKR